MEREMRVPLKGELALKESEKAEEGALRRSAKGQAARTIFTRGAATASPGDPSIPGVPGSPGGPVCTSSEGL